MNYGTSVRIKNHPRLTGCYGVIVKKSDKGYMVSIDKNTCISLMSHQLEIFASDGTILVDANEVFEEFNFKPEYME